MGGVNENETRLSAITEALDSHIGAALCATIAIWRFRANDWNRLLDGSEFYARQPRA